ncbi:MAG: toll/interleukin-1 receptor domain-containing protein, partial [Candidatus Acidiferrales bacterium]
MAFDVFISYASKDKIVADAVCARLEASGIRCWIAPRDIVAGTSYGEAIIEAIHGAKVMVLVFSSSANASGHIPKEVKRAVSSGVAVLPFRIEDVAPGKSLDYFIGSVHWLDAMTPPMEKHLDNLAATVHKLLPVKTDDVVSPPADPTVMWQRNAAVGAASHAPTVLASAA